MLLSRSGLTRLVDRLDRYSEAELEAFGGLWERLGPADQGPAR